MLVNFEVQENATVVSPSFHDGHLVGIEVGPGLVDIALTTVAGERYRLCLRGVRSFVANDMREGNIVSSLFILTGRRPAPDLSLDEVDTPPHPMAAAEFHATHLQRREALVEDIAAGRLTLVWLDPAYGARFDALCEGVELFRSP